MDDQNNIEIGYESDYQNTQLNVMLNSGTYTIRVDSLNPESDFLDISIRSKIVNSANVSEVILAN